MNARRNWSALALSSAVSALSFWQLILTLLFTAGTAHAAPPEESLVFRAEIEIKVADCKDAGTDDGVNVQLNDNNLTWLDYGRDDLERNRLYAYDLVPIRNIQDITMLRVAKTGSDGVAIESLALRINGIPIFRKNFGRHWLDNEKNHSTQLTIDSQELRNNSSWIDFPALVLPPFFLPRVELESRIESLVGHTIHGQQLYWGHLHGRAVEVSRTDSSTIHVDLDLAASVPVIWDPEVDVDFDIRFACNGGQISLTVMNAEVDTDYPWYIDIFTLTLLDDVIQLFVPDSLNDSLNNIMTTLDTGAGFCPQITVSSDGGVGFTLF